MPISIVLEAANRPDFKLFRETLRGINIKRPRPTGRHPQGISLDKGYDFPEVETIARRFGFDLHLRHKGEEKIKLPKGFKARRWKVERSHSWFNRYRGVLIRWEKEAENYEAMLHIAAALMTARMTK